MENEEKIYQSALTRREAAAVLAFIPIQFLLLPYVLARFILSGALSETRANFILYAVGVVYMLVFAMDFLRRDFYTLCDRPVRTGLQVLLSYGLMLVCNTLVGLILVALGFEENPNNAAVGELTKAASGTMTAMAVFLAPIVEEIIFRGGIFGLLRRHSRLWAYLGSILIFSLYHVWSYALYDWKNFIFIIQYIPASWLLCRCYEKTESIWTPILLHMLINGISMQVMGMLA